MSEKPLGAGDPAFKVFFCIRGFVENDHPSLFKNVKRFLDKKFHKKREIAYCCTYRLKYEKA